MFTSNSFKVLLLSVFVLLFCFNESQAGKPVPVPVPGAKLIVKSDPGDELIATGTTNNNGQIFGSIPNSVASNTTKIKMFVDFPENIWTYLAAKYGKVGIYNFNWKMKIGNKEYTDNFSVNPQSKISGESFPQSLPNIDNEIPSRISVPFDITLTCTGGTSRVPNIQERKLWTTVNHYGINEEGIKSYPQGSSSVANIPIKVYLLPSGNSSNNISVTNCTFVADCVTDAKGNFSFDFPQDSLFTTSGTFVFEIGTPTKETKQPLITAKFTSKTPRPFLYRLLKQKQQWVVSQ